MGMGINIMNLNWSGLGLGLVFMGFGWVGLGVWAPTIVSVLKKNIELRQVIKWYGKRMHSLAFLRLEA